MFHNLGNKFLAELLLGFVRIGKSKLCYIKLHVNIIWDLQAFREKIGNFLATESEIFLSIVIFVFKLAIL